MAAPGTRAASASSAQVLDRSQVAETGVVRLIQEVVRRVALGAEAELRPLALEVRFDAGRGQVRVERREDEAGARPQHPEGLVEEDLRPCQMLRDERAQHRVERAGLERQRLVEVGLRERESGQLAAGDAQHAERDVDTDGPRAGLTQGQAVGAGAASGVEDALAGLRPQVPQRVPAVEGDERVPGPVVGGRPPIVAGAHARAADAWRHRFSAAGSCACVAEAWS